MKRHVHQREGVRELGQNIDIFADYYLICYILTRATFSIDQTKIYTLQ